MAARDGERMAACYAPDAGNLFSWLLICVSSENAVAPFCCGVHSR
jgi:hypothetical protein